MRSKTPAQILSFRLHTSLPEASPPLKQTPTRRTSGHCLGTLKTGVNKEFWEELIAYFPRNDTGHVEKDASNNSSNVACVFVTAVTFLPIRCLASIGGLHRHTHTQTATWSHKPNLFFQNRKLVWKYFLPPLSLKYSISHYPPSPNHVLFSVSSAHCRTLKWIPYDFMWCLSWMKWARRGLPSSCNVTLTIIHWPGSAQPYLWCF
jgi:hypothetical protein